MENRIKVRDKWYEDMVGTSSGIKIQEGLRKEEEEDKEEEDEEEEEEEEGGLDYQIHFSPYSNHKVL